MPATRCAPGSTWEGTCSSSRSACARGVRSRTLAKTSKFPITTTPRTSRFLGAWKRLGLRSGAGFSQMLLFVSYCTLLAPFGLLARFGKHAPATRDLPAVKAERSLRGQA